MITPYLISTNYQKVLRFFLLHPDQSFYEREIARKAVLSPSSAHYILSNLNKAGLLRLKRNGRMRFYSIDKANPYLKQFKVLINLLCLEPLIEKLKPITHKIILYGSWSNGTDKENSDIDLYIVSSQKEKVVSVVNKFSQPAWFGDHKIQPIIAQPEELLKKDARNEVFLEEVAKGNTLWEKEINEDIL